MHDAPAACLRRVLAFMEVQPAVSDDVIAAAVRFARFDNLREMERTRAFDARRLQPTDAADEESYKVRRGKVGGYVDYLDQQDIAFCRHAVAQAAIPWLQPNRRRA